MYTPGNKFTHRLPSTACWRASWACPQYTGRAVICTVKSSKLPVANPTQQLLAKQARSSLDCIYLRVMNVEGIKEPRVAASKTHNESAVFSIASDAQDTA